MPFMSTLAGTPPGVNTISFTGLPEISTSRPPTWNEPMSRSAIGAWAQPETIETARLRIARTADPPFNLLGFACQFFEPHDFHGESSEERRVGKEGSDGRRGGQGATQRKRDAHSRRKYL